MPAYPNTPSAIGHTNHYPTESPETAPATPEKCLNGTSPGKPNGQTSPASKSKVKGTGPMSSTRPEQPLNSSAAASQKKTSAAEKPTGAKAPGLPTEQP